MQKCVASCLTCKRILQGRSPAQALIRGGADIEATDETGLSPLYYAVLSEKVDTIRVSHGLFAYSRK